MPGISFTQEDIASNSKLEAAWYSCDIKSVTAGPGTTDPSTTTWKIELQVAEGPMAGVPIVHFINDKSAMTKKLGKLFAYIGAFVSKVEPDKNYPLEETAGKKIAAYAVYDIERGDNVCKDFRKAA